MLKNPFLVYILAFGSVLAIYQLGWSMLYPTLSAGLLLFFALTFLASLLLAWLVSSLVTQIEPYPPALLPGMTVWLIVGTFVIELINEGGVPLRMVAQGQSFYHHEEAVIHLHAFSLWSVFSTIRFADFLYSKRRRYLFEATLPVIFYLLLVYRGPALITLVSWAFLIVIKRGRLGVMAGIGTTVAALLVFYVNGVIGDLRSPGQELSGGPSPAFLQSGIPHTYFWSYLYATAPMANFQLTVNTLTESYGNAGEFIASELLPDYISKRILPRLDDRILVGQGNLATRDLLYTWRQPQIAPGINIATIFARSFGYFGWLGPVAMFVALGMFIFLYLLLIVRSPYAVPSLALLNTLIVFCLFNNMLASTAILPQLLWPLLLPPWRLGPAAQQRAKGQPVPS